LTLAGFAVRFFFSNINTGILDMRILVLTLMMSFVSQGAFASFSFVKLEGFADPEEYTQTQEEGTTFENVPKEIRQLTTTFLSLKDLKAFSEASTSSRDLARETMAQEGFILNMEDIEEKDIESLTKLLFDTTNVTKIKIQGLRWNILKAVLESNLELRFENLKELNLSYNGIDEGMIAEINNLLFSRMRLTSLNLGYNHIGVAGATAIANSLHMAKLTSLDLERNQIGDVGARAIANSEHMKNLTSLNLAWNQIGDVGASAIANSPHMARLNSLNLGLNQLGDKGAQAIANSKYMARLTSLDLGWNHIGEAGATAIAESEYMARLTSLNLYNNQIRDDVKVVIRNRLRQTHPRCVVVL
jgi:Leucine-rich repeat (LRR) protein